MAHVVALLIFAALSATTWIVALACYKSTCADGPNTPAPPGCSAVSACAIGAVTLTCFILFPFGYVAGLIAWSVAVFGFLNLPTGRAAVLVAYLALSSGVSRLVAPGVLSVL